MKKTMRVVFALGLIVLSLDLFRPKATDNILIGKWGFSGKRFIFHPDGVVEFHTDWMTFTNAADAIFGIEPEDYYLGEWKETNDEPSPWSTKHIFMGKYMTYDCGKRLRVDIRWINVDGRPLPENTAWRTITDVLFDVWGREYEMTVKYMDPDVSQYYKSDDE